jgi:glutaredoxin 3
MPEEPTEPILYTQASCAESAKVRAWLVEREIAFTERDLSRDPEAAQALAATDVFATPLLVVGEETVLGFRPEALAAALALVGHEP